MMVYRLQNTQRKAKIDGKRRHYQRDSGIPQSVFVVNTFLFNLFKNKISKKCLNKTVKLPPGALLCKTGNHGI